MIIRNQLRSVKICGSDGYKAFEPFPVYIFCVDCIGFQCFHCFNTSQVNALCLVRALHRGDNAMAGDHLVKLAQSDQHGETEGETWQQT